MITETLSMRADTKQWARTLLELCLTMSGFGPRTYKVKGVTKVEDKGEDGKNEYDFVVEFKGEKGVFTNGKS